MTIIQVGRPAAVLLLLATAAAAQPPPPAAGGRVRVFVDCQNTSCDQEFFRTEVTFVDHLRERQEADVHLLLTSQSTGGGGSEITFSFFGQGRFKGRDHVLRLTTVPAQAQDAIRRQMTRLMSIGFVPYALDSPAAQTLAVTLQAAPTAAAAAQDDPWDRWTFRIGANGNINGEKSNRSLYLNGSVNANRTTAAYKLNVSSNFNYNESRFELTDGRQFIAPTRSYNLNGLWVKSLNAHWSVGARGNVNSSTFSNIDRSIGVFPAIEYDIFPYSESTRRLLTIRYEAGVRHNDYVERTVYGKDSEAIGAHAVNGYLSLRQRWGTVSSGVEAASFIPEMSKNHVTGWGNLNLNLVKGLGLNFYTELTSLRDQVSLASGGASNEEVLVRQTQLATRYRYYFNFGVTYTFGSIYSPIVNPRFGN